MEEAQSLCDPPKVSEPANSKPGLSPKEADFKVSVHCYTGAEQLWPGKKALSKQ